MPDTETSSKPNNLSELIAMTDMEGMRAETGYGEEDQVPTIRVSGYISLLLGLFSWAAMLGIGGVAIAVLAILFGIVAIRPVRFGAASGIRPAKLGIALGIGFAFCGFFLSSFKTNCLGKQAEKFAHDYIDLMNSENKIYAIELAKSYRNRFSTTMPLAAHYRELELNAPSSRETEQPSTLDSFRDDAGHQMILGEGPDAQWVLDRPVTVYHQFRIDRAEVVLISKESGKLLRIVLQYLIDSKDMGQWHKELVRPYQKRIVAESIL